jgi:hypothetical protein
MFRTVFAVCAMACAAPSLHAAGQPLEVKELSIILEVNETDGDAEIVVKAKTEIGMKKFWVRRPDGKKVAEAVSDDKSKTHGPIGMAEVLYETGEPDIAHVQASYPEGIYEFHGRTVDNQDVYGEIVLSHALLPAPTFTPNDGDTLDKDSVVVAWTAVAGAAFYVVEVENDDLGVNLTVTMDGNATSFAVPAGFLLADTEYELGVATVTATGNPSFAEIAFVTAP